MIMAMGVGSWVGGMFHLITHAFFKALLFLGSGSVIAAMHHEQEMPQYGGLMRKIPLTAITFGIAVLTIAGTPGFSGFYSKDMIVRHAAAFAGFAVATGHSPWYWAFYVLPTAIAYVTAFYMMRCWMLTFWGKPRNQHLYDHAHETALLWGPLAVLAVLSIISGYGSGSSSASSSGLGIIGAETLISSATNESDAYCQRLAHDPDLRVFAKASPVDVPEGASVWDKAAQHAEELTAPLKSWLFWGFLVGIGGGFLMYRNGYAVASRLYAFKPFRWVHTWLYHRMYFDELYSVLLVGLLMTISWICAMFDRFVVDGLVNFSAYVVLALARLAGRCDHYIVDGAVNGAADLAQNVGALVRTPQTGRVRMYVTVLMVAVALGMAATVIFVLS
jgi:NADH-quinone oxidoreductase subunit L